jgi:hypothetical protein
MILVNLTHVDHDDPPYISPSSFIQSRHYFTSTPFDLNNVTASYITFIYRIESKPSTFGMMSGYP